MTDINYKRLPLQSFAIGDSLRIFQTNISGQIFYAQNFEKETDNYKSNIFVNDEDKLKFKYLMTGNKKYSINKLMSEEFKNDLSNIIIDDSLSGSKHSLNYYDTDKFEFNYSNNRIFQVKNKCYILNKNSYVDENDDVLNIKKYKDNESYILSQFFKNSENLSPSSIWNYYVNDKKLKNDFLNTYSKFKNTNNTLKESLSDEFYSTFMNNNISSYISENYSDEFFDKSKNVNNKAIPIYDLDRKALEKLYIIRLFDREHILDLLNDNNLNSISGNVLFNSQTYSYDNEDFDSLSIVEIYNYLNNFEDGEERQNKFFDELLSYIPKESFFRMFIPVGWINLSNDFYKMTKINDEVEYLYSIKLTDDSNDFKSINYFALKSLSNPELNYDYSIALDTNFESINPKYFNFSETIKNKILSVYEEEVVNKLNEFVNKNNLYYMSGSFISENGLDENDKLKNVYKSKFVRVDEETLTKIFDDKEFKKPEYFNAYLTAYKMYMYDNYYINLDINSLSFSISKLITELNIYFTNFLNEYNKIKSSFPKEKIFSVFDMIFELIQNGSGDEIPKRKR